MSREIKFRMVYQTTGEIIGYTDVYRLLRNGGDELPDYEKAILQGVAFEQYTGLKDKNGDKEIYEYDIIDGEGNIIGNYHETPELLKDKTNLLIQGFGTKTWLTTYQEAVERGCHDA